MKGTWVNPRTGHKFTVKDTVIVDGEFKVITTQGQEIGLDLVQDYIQEVKSSKSPAQPVPTQSEMPIEVINELEGIMIEDDYRYVDGLNGQPLGNIYNQPSPEQLMVERVLKSQASPKVKISFDWKVPQEQIDTLTGVLGVSIDDIISYYVDSLEIDIESIKQDYIKHIKKTLEPKKEVKKNGTRNR